MTDMAVILLFAFYKNTTSGETVIIVGNGLVLNSG